MAPIATRQRFLELAIDQLGCPYIWGGKGEHYEYAQGDVRFRVFDCSGLVTFCLHAAGGPDWRMDHNADALYRMLPITVSAEPGDLAFYGPVGGPAIHVVIHVGNGKGAIIGSNGGSSDCTTIERSEEHRAGVRIDVRGPHYRRDYIGSRSMANYLSPPIEGTA